MNYLKVIITLGFIIFTSSNPASAEVDLELKGLSMEEIENRFGSPPKRLKKSNNRESWIYGASIVMFRDKVVEAWSDSGELSHRHNSRQEVSEVLSGQLWENPWTPANSPSKEAVMKELLEEKNSE